MVGIALLGVGVLAGIGAAVVHGLDDAALGGVQVFLDARSLQCADSTDVTTVADGPVAVPAVSDAAGLDCTLSVVVRNASDRDVGIQRVVFDGLGPDSAGGAHADHAFTQGLAPYPGGDGTQAVFDYVRDPRAGEPYLVSAGSSVRLRFHLSAAGCERAGDSAVWTGDPVVVVATGIATRAVPLAGAGLGVAGSATATCSG